MYNKGRLSSSRIGTRNDTNSSYGNRWHPVNDRDSLYYDDRRASCSPEYDRNVRNCDDDRHSHDQDFGYSNNRYSSNGSYNRNSYDQHTHHHNDRQTPIRSQYERYHDSEYAYDEHPKEQYLSHRYSSKGDCSRSQSGNPGTVYDRNPHFYENRRDSYQPKYDRNVRSYDNDRISKFQGVNYGNDEYSSNDDYGRGPSKNSDYQNDFHREDRRPISQRENNRSVKNYHNDRHPRDRDVNHTNNRYTSNDNYDCSPSRNSDYQYDYNQDSNYYDNRRLSHSYDRRNYGVRRYSDYRGSSSGNGRDDRPHRGPSEYQHSRDDYDNRMPDQTVQSVCHFSNRERHQTSPPRWSIDGLPVTFTEYHRIQANMRRQIESKKAKNYFKDYDEEEEFRNLVNKMKIGQRDREKLAEEIGFNDIPPPPVERPRRGGIHRFPN